LLLSTFAVHLASAATSDASRLFHTAAVELANVAAYGALWVIQFVLCDRILFRTPPDRSKGVVDDRPVSVPQTLREHTGSVV
jgi:hypothetical protein